MISKFGVLERRGENGARGGATDLSPPRGAERGPFWRSLPGCHPDVLEQNNGKFSNNSKIMGVTHIFVIFSLQQNGIAKLKLVCLKVSEISNFYCIFR